MVVGATAVALTASGATALPLTAAGASAARHVVPLAGNWEGSGSHGLPLSFALVRRHGRLQATSIALGAPLTCPANERDAEVVPLSQVAYAGPGAGGGSSPAVLSGLAERGDLANITGAFATRSSGSFSAQVKGSVGCGWPAGTLSWRVHRVRRLRVADRTWTAQLSGPTIVGGEVKLAVSAHGRVLESFQSSFTCRASSSAGSNRFAMAPAYEFIRPDGRFFSPLHGNAIKRHPTIWAGRFTAGGLLTGTLSIYDSCTRRLVDATFTAAVPSRHGR